MDDATEDATAATTADATADRGPFQVAGAALHPLLVAVPIGAYVSAVAFDVASRIAEGYVYARGAQWLLVIGLVSSVAAAAVGVTDSVRRVGPGTPERAVVIRHAGLNTVAFVLFVISLAVRRSDLNGLLDGTPTTALVLSVAGLLALASSAFTGAVLDGRLRGRT